MKNKVIIAITTMLMLLFICSIGMKGEGNNEIQTAKEITYTYFDYPLAVNLLAYSPAINSDIVVEDIAHVTEAKVVKADVLEDEFQGYKLPLDKDLQKYISDLCKKYNLSFEMVLGVINIESEFDPTLNDNGADFGLMQLNKPSGTLAWLSKEIENDKSLSIDKFNWKNPYHNASAGIWYLNWIRNEMNKMGYNTQDFATVLVGYNMGIGNAKKYLRNNSPHSWKYVKVVKTFKNKLENGEKI